MDFFQLLEAVNTPEILHQLAGHVSDIIPADGLNAVGNNPLIPEKPISNLPTI